MKKSSMVAATLASSAVLLAGCGGHSTKDAASAAPTSARSSSSSSSSTPASGASSQAVSASSSPTGPTTTKAGSTAATTSRPGNTAPSQAATSSGAANIPTLVAGVPQTEGGRLVGLGTTKPSEIDLSWNATDIVGGIKWQTWGGQTAQGIGAQANWTSGAQADAKAVPTYVTLYRGTCGGKLVYRYMASNFTGFAQNSRAQSVDLCNLPGATPG